MTALDDLISQIAQDPSILESLSHHSQELLAEHLGKDWVQNLIHLSQTNNTLKTQTNEENGGNEGTGWWEQPYRCQAS